MSFLYQALIKEKNKQNSADATASAAQTIQNQSAAQSETVNNYGYNMGAAAPSEVKTTSHWFWLVIAVLLMVVGLLGGYLFGSKDNNEQLYSSIQNQTTAIQQKQNELERDIQQIELEKQSTTKNVTTEVKGASTEKQIPEKQIAVAVDQNGQVQTQVTDAIAAQQSSEVGVQEQLLERNVVPEVALSEIPDSLKSSFADAVKATEQKAQTELFQAEITSGSSLPLINELQLSEIYWVPDIEYQMHIYASDKSERWIRVNNNTLTEGEALIDDLVLLEIRQDQIIWQGRSRRFAQNALEDFTKQ